jgi:large subunit ribosomal protein L9
MVKMKVILQQDVKGTGKKGEVIEVSEGYGRNFLLPKKLAVLANAQNVNLAKQKAGSAAHRKAQEADEAKLLASQLAKAEVTVAVKVGEGGKLFGSVSGKDVSEALKKEHGVEIDKRKITITQEVTGIGDYEAVIKLHPEASAKVLVHVTEG